MWDVYDDDEYDASVDDRNEIFTCIKDGEQGMDLLFSYSSPFYDTNEDSNDLRDDLIKLGDPVSLEWLLLQMWGMK